MNKMFFLCFALLSLLQSLLAVELSIYNSFTRVRQSHKGSGDYIYGFSNGEYENLIDGSINWEGTPFVRQEVYNTIESLENAKVTIRRSTACECETIEAKIIDPTSMLLQNLKTGAYFYADKQSVEYTSARPDEEGKALKFQFASKTTEYTGTLSYLMRGITWKPDYDLILTGDNDSVLHSYANIRNDQAREYPVENTYLLGGNVQLANGYRAPSAGFDARKSASRVESIQVGSEQQGVYSYTLKEKYTLRPSSSIRLPFIDILAKYRFYYKTSVNIGVGQSQGVFARYYDLTPNQFMPAGIITIYDNQVLVGQANLPDVPKEYKQAITVGQDNDIRYLVNGNLTGKSVENATISSETYELDVEIINLKNKKVDAQLVINAGAQMILHDTTCNAAKVNGNQIVLLAQLEKGENRPCKFHLTMRYT